MCFYDRLKRILSWIFEIQNGGSNMEANIFKKRTNFVKTHHADVNGRLLNRI